MELAEYNYKSNLPIDLFQYVDDNKDFYFKKDKSIHFKLKLAEECAELSAALLGNFLKVKDKSDAIYEELADVIVSLVLHLSKMNYDELNIIQSNIEEKLEKLKSYIDKGYFTEYYKQKLFE